MPSRAGGALYGSFSHFHRSRETNNCCRNSATRLDKLQPKVLFNWRNFSSRIAISAVQIWVCTAFSVVPTKVLTFKPCFSALKNNSICPDPPVAPLARFLVLGPAGDQSDNP